MTTGAREESEKEVGHEGEGKGERENTKETVRESLKERRLIGVKERKKRERKRSPYAAVSRLTCLRGGHFMPFPLHCYSLAV